MKKIPSFSKNHDELKTGLHECGTSHGVTTWDLRFKTPNGGDYLPVAAMHTVEHLMATVLRNSGNGDKVIYFGPMGCRTGCYLLLFKIQEKQAREITIECLKKCLELDYVPGTKPKECGNYREHDLKEAQEEIEAYLKVLQDN